MSTECIPANNDVWATFPAAYVKSLEDHVAELEGHLQESRALTGSSQTYEHQLQSFETPSVETIAHPGNFPNPGSWRISHLQHEISSDELLCNAIVPEQSDMLFPSYIDSSTSVAGSTPSTLAMGGNNTMSGHSLNLSNVTRSLISAKISSSEGASYFQTYFEIIHPRYPFLNVAECSEAYLEWKTRSSLAEPIRGGWTAFLVKMVIESLLTLKHYYSECC